MLTITLPVLPPPCSVEEASDSSCDSSPCNQTPDVAALSEAKPPSKTTTVSVGNPACAAPALDAVEETRSAAAKAAADDKPPLKTTTASVSNPRSISYDSYHNCMDSFKKIRWNVDLHRKASPGAGKGIFCLSRIVEDTCVALYFGNLVDDKGVVVVPCPFTESLFKRLPNVQRPYSRGHGVSVNSRACPHVLNVDGSHHACSAYDSFFERCGVPWGSCLNSSDKGGRENCKIVW
jgi:hypothetical protein